MSTKFLAVALGGAMFLGSLITSSTTFANPAEEQTQINAEQQATADQQVAWWYWHRPGGYYYYDHPGYYHRWYHPWR